MFFFSSGAVEEKWTVKDDGADGITTVAEHLAI